MARNSCWSRSTALRDRKSTRLNSSHDQTSYAVFCLKKKKRHARRLRRAHRRRPSVELRRLSARAERRGRARACARGIFFFNDTATTEIYTLSLHDALPISTARRISSGSPNRCARSGTRTASRSEEHTSELQSRSERVCRLLLEKQKDNHESDGSTTADNAGQPAVPIVAVI